MTDPDQIPRGAERIREERENPDYLCNKIDSTCGNFPSNFTRHFCFYICHLTNSQLCFSLEMVINTEISRSTFDIFMS